ncbi:MAG: hypothetical protein JNK12_25110 [Acidimicrobiales bacterium]|nr:hypothetical protein [Acidimicrobiales bacterium]
MDEPTHDQEAGVVLAAQAIVDSVALDVDLDAMAADLDGVDSALRRLDDGTYGTCEVCTADLADDVLEADPVARRCANHPLATTLPGTAPRFEAASPVEPEEPADADAEEATSADVADVAKDVADAADLEDPDDGAPPPYV